MFQANELGGIPARVDALRTRYAQTDAQHADIVSMRRGNFEQVAPDMFSDDWRKPIVANMIDTAARDSAAMLAPLPAFNCSASSMLNEKAKVFADKRTKIARSYVDHSDLELQMAMIGADSLVTFGMVVFAVEPCFEEHAPRIKVESALGAYAVWDRHGITKEFARVFYRDWFALRADYPEARGLDKTHPTGVLNDKVEVVKYVSATRVITYLPKLGNYVLEDMANPMGKCYYHVERRPNPDPDGIKGAFDDVVWVQLARHRIQMLLMEGVEKSVRAPIVLPMDADNLSFGPDAVIRTQQGAGAVGRARLDMPAQAFGAVDQLKQEQREGAMSPEARSGSMDASVITGRGVQELMGGFSTQIAILQIVLKHAYKWAVATCFDMDEKLFTHRQKEIRGNDAGVPYSIKYTPAKDIDGDHTVDVSYGFAAGLDPNRALVFLLQADGAGLVSKDYVRRSLPVDLNAAEEEKKIIIEQSRQGLTLAMSALAQSIPQLAAAGQDPLPIIAKQAKFIQLLGKGKDVETAATEALAPPKPPPGASSPGAPSPDGSAPGGEGGPAGFNDAGLPGGLKPGLANEGPNGRPDLNMLFAGMTAAGNPNLQAGVSRMTPAGS